jgi:hypothetical protein
MGDFAWVPATPPLSRVAGTLVPALPKDATSRLVLAATSDARVTVTLAAPVPGDGDAASTVTTREVVVRAGRATSVDLEGADRVWLATGSESLHAALVVDLVDDDGPMLAALPVRSAPLGVRSVPVRPVG